MELPFKKIIRKGEKYIMVEDGKPAYVVMHYDDYVGLVDHGGAPREAQGSFVAEDIGGFGSEAILAGPKLPEDISKIRLEDLPL